MSILENGPQNRQVILLFVKLKLKPKLMVRKPHETVKFLSPIKKKQVLICKGIWVGSGMACG